MFSSFVRRPAVRVLPILTALALGLASCGGDNTGAIIIVPNAVIATDLTGDGFVDVAVAGAQIDETGLTQKPGLLKVSINTKSSPGTFPNPAGYPTSAAPPSGLAVGDLTGNGSHDFVVSNFNAGTVAILKETSPTSGAYGVATPITVGGHPNDVQVADLNGDGLPDLIVADDLGRVVYLLQNPASPGAFQAPVALPITNRGISVAVGDLNGDGLPDLAVTSFDTNGDFGLLTIYFQDPSHPGTFITTPTTIATYGEPSQVKIADINQDGAADIIIALQGTGAAADSTADPTTPAFAESLYGALVIEQNVSSPGTFATPSVYPAVIGTISLAIGDLNNDGLPDIAMASLYPQGSGYVVTMMQDPSTPGSFLTAAPYTGSGQPVSIVIADVDHDGLPDLVVADSTDATWYKNQSTAVGSFVLEAQIGL